MTGRSELQALQELLVAALYQPDPGAWLRARALDTALDLGDEARAQLAAADADGLRLTALVVHKLRFERLLRGDPRLAAAFERDPGGFTARWRAYCAAVPPAAVFPEEEAARFRAFEA